MARSATRAELLAALEALAFLPSGKQAVVTEERLAEMVRHVRREEDGTKFDWREQR